MDSKVILGWRSRISSFALLFILIVLTVSCASRRDAARVRALADQPLVVIETHYDHGDIPLSIHFEPGKAFNHPLMAIWVEDTQGNYIQTLYVAQSIAQGVYRHGDPSSGRWQPGPVRRPATLPYWAHKRGVQASDGLYIPEESDPMPDALTGATPKGKFLLKTYAPEKEMKIFRVLFEINQSWDWNRYWTNNKFPEDKEYKTSSQPAVVYEAVIEPGSGILEYEMKPIGHSHWSGATGELFDDLSSLTTALEIAGKITVRVGNR